MIHLLLLCLPLLAASPGQIKKARQLSRAAAKAYKAKRYEQALEKFKAANRLAPHPNLDVNIGRSYEALKQPDQAMIHCKIVLNAADVPERTRKAAQKCVERVIALLARPILEIKSRPSGASLRVDGRLLGRSPWRGSVEPGRRRIDLELEGYAPETSTVNAEWGGEYPLSFRLSPAQVGGLLSLESQPSGAQVIIDGELLGQTPLRDLQLSAQSHTLSVRLKDHHPHDSIIRIKDGDSLSRAIMLLSVRGSGRPQWPGWSMTGLGAAALGLGGYFGVQALEDRDEADSLARTSGQEQDRRRYESLVEGMNSNRQSADLLFTLGGAACVAGLSWLLWPED